MTTAVKSTRWIRIWHVTAGGGEQKSPILLQDNTRFHAPKKTLQKLTDLGYEKLLIQRTRETCLQRTIVAPGISTVQGKVFKNQTDAETAFEDFITSRSPDLYRKDIF